jgi:hypothetical protein
MKVSSLAPHFDLDNVAAYAAWRAQKLAVAPRRLEDILVEIYEPRKLRPSERERLLGICAVANMAIYASRSGHDGDKEIPRLLGLQLGLRSLDCNYLADDDGISPLSAQAENGPVTRREFIPYTNKPIRWHTDGYYNPPEHTVRGMVLHCVESAQSGGDNQLLDHEIAYILLRDEDPAHIRALMAVDAMTIPARVEEQGIARPEQAGPVFSISADGYLHMRYTARTRSIVWKDDAATRAAVAALERILAGGTAWTLQGRLEPGMGLVCNNVLHDRSGFSDSSAHRRLLYRARYYERISA